MLHDYIPNSHKSEHVHKLINEALDILKSVGIPFEKKKSRGLEKMAMSFLAVAGITKSWKDAKGQNEGRELKSKEIIRFINQHFEESISEGSYDDIRRKDLKLPVLADLILNSSKNPHAAPNDPTRGYSLSGDFKSLVINYNTSEWEIKLKLFNKNRPSLEEILKHKRSINKVPVFLPGGINLLLSPGGHNQLQREIVEEFLPRFGYGCDILYIGDSKDRILVKDVAKLESLGFFDLGSDSLPDIVAYSQEKNWLFLIEAFYSSGPMSEERVLELKKALPNCKAGLVFVTAFISKRDFFKHIHDIAWESEVWTADNADHMVHFNGDKFLGPHT